jgi:Ca2+-binding RTX toxin-like protein
MALTVLLVSGVAFALNTIQCKTNKVCYGTPERDLMKGTDGRNDMSGRGAADILKGFRGQDNLYGDNGDDRVLAGRGRDQLVGVGGDDTLEGGKGSDYYQFDALGGWGNDTIVDIEIPDKDVNTGNAVSIYHRYRGKGLTINLNSDSGPVPEMTNGTDTVNWSGNVIDNVHLEVWKNDKIVGNGRANAIWSTAGLGGELDHPRIRDHDHVDARGGNDVIFVPGDKGTDIVECGAGTDTVYFDEKDVLLFPEDCERKNLFRNGVYSPASWY